MQVEIVGHDGRADDSDGDVEHASLAEVRRNQGLSHREETGLCLREDKDFDEVTDGDGGDQQQNHGFNAAHSKLLKSEEEENVDSGDDDGPEQRDVEHQVEGDRAAEDFGEVAGADGDLAHHPVGPAGPAGIPVAATLGEILAGHDTQTSGDDLHEDGHEAGEADDREESVFELGATLKIGAPVAGVHVADADEDGGADEGAPLLPESGVVMRDGNGTVGAL